MVADVAWSLQETPCLQQGARNLNCTQCMRPRQSFGVFSSFTSQSCLLIAYTQAFLVIPYQNTVTASGESMMGWVPFLPLFLDGNALLLHHSIFRTKKGTPSNMEAPSSLGYDSLAVQSSAACREGMSVFITNYRCGSGLS